LVAELSQDLAGRPDENDPGLFGRLRELGALGEKTVAGMDRVRATIAHRPHDRVDIQVTLGRLRGANRARLVGRGHVGAARIGLGIHRHGPNTHYPRGADDADGNFSAIGDQELADLPFGHRLKLTSDCRPEKPLIVVQRWVYFSTGLMVFSAESLSARRA